MSIDNVNKYFNEILVQYNATPVSLLAKKYNINIEAKNFYNVLFNSLVKENGGIAAAKELQKNDYIIKTIKLNQYGSLKESVSLPVFDYMKIVEEDWETSTLRSYFVEKTFIFVVFQSKDNDAFLQNIIVWKMPMNILDSEVSAVWDRTVRCLKEGRIVKYIDDNNRFHTFFPSASSGPYVHVRPHAQNKCDTMSLPVKDALTGLSEYPKHSFWLNKAYIVKIIRSAVVNE